LAVLLVLLVAIVAGVFERDSKESQRPPLVLDYSASTVSQITIHGQQQRQCRLDRRANTLNWRLSQPFSAAASDIAVQKLLQLPAKRDYQPLSANNNQLEQYGLAKPQWRLRIGDITVDWGGVNALDHRRYIQVEQQQQFKLLLIEEDLTPFLQDCPKNLISKALLEPGQQLRGLHLADLSISQVNGEWAAQPAPPPNWSQDALHRYLDDWRSAQALMVEHFDQALLELKPEYRLSLQIEQGELNFLAFRLNGQIWWACPERQLRYYLFPNIAQKLLHPFSQQSAG